MSGYDRIINFDDANERARVMQGIHQMRGTWRFIIKRYRKRRSDAQNAYYWGVVVPAVRQGLIEAWGETLSGDEVHEYLKSMFLMKPIVNRATGELVGTRPGSSAKLDIAEFGEYADRIAVWAGEYLGVEVPPPERTCDGDRLARAQRGG